MTQQVKDLYEVLRRPVITEKSTLLGELQQYVFEVSRDSNKIEIKKAFELAFPGRKVMKVRTINGYSEKRRFGKRVGRTQAVKKAVITIQGDPIELFNTGA